MSNSVKPLITKNGVEKRRFFVFAIYAIWYRFFGDDLALLLPVGEVGGAVRELLW